MFVLFAVPDSWVNGLAAAIDRRPWGTRAMLSRFGSLVHSGALCGACTVGPCCVRCVARAPWALAVCAGADQCDAHRFLLELPPLSWAAVGAARLNGYFLLQPNRFVLVRRSCVACAGCLLRREFSRAQIGYVVLVGGAFGCFIVVGYPQLGGDNLYMGAWHRCVPWCACQCLLAHVARGRPRAGYRAPCVWRCACGCSTWPLRPMPAH